MSLADRVIATGGGSPSLGINRKIPQSLPELAVRRVINEIFKVMLITRRLSGSNLLSHTYVARTRSRRVPARLGLPRLGCAWVGTLSASVRRLVESFF